MEVVLWLWDVETGCQDVLMKRKINSISILFTWGPETFWQLAFHLCRRCDSPVSRQWCLLRIFAASSPFLLPNWLFLQHKQLSLSCCPSGACWELRRDKACLFPFTARLANEGDRKQHPNRTIGPHLLTLILPKPWQTSWGYQLPQSLRGKNTPRVHRLLLSRSLALIHIPYLTWPAVTLLQTGSL